MQSHWVMFVCKTARIWSGVYIAVSSFWRSKESQLLWIYATKSLRFWEMESMRPHFPGYLITQSNFYSLCTFQCIFTFSSGWTALQRSGLVNSIWSAGKFLWIHQHSLPIHSQTQVLYIQNLKIYHNYLELKYVFFDIISRDCPDDIKEAVSTLIYAAAWCGDLPELQPISRLFGWRYGHKFAKAAAESRPGSLVNSQVGISLWSKLVDNQFSVLTLVQ